MTVGLCLVVGSMRYLQAGLHDILQAEERASAGVLYLQVVTGPQESRTRAELLCHAGRGNIHLARPRQLSLCVSSFLSDVGHARQGGLAEQVHISCKTPEDQILQWILSVKERYENLPGFFPSSTI